MRRKPARSNRRAFAKDGARYHLHKVFTKLEISSRNQLDQVLPSESREALQV
jgi:hypothetical protein